LSHILMTPPFLFWPVLCFLFYEPSFFLIFFRCHTSRYASKLTVFFKCIISLSPTCSFCSLSVPFHLIIVCCLFFKCIVVPPFASYNLSCFFPHFPSPVTSKLYIYILCMGSFPIPSVV
jgi:hypothetical protein